MLKLSICVPCFNRPNELRELICSYIPQRCTEAELLIVENCSPHRDEIRKVISSFSSYPDIRYLENDSNIGYDANIRRLVDLALGEYCLFLGNDDLLELDAIQTVIDLIQAYPQLGQIIRSYQYFRGSRENIVEVFRYTSSDMALPPSLEASIYAFRRSVTLAGMTFKTSLAKEAATIHLDGSLLYQVYLSSSLALRSQTVVTSSILSSYRMDGTPDFGHAATERKYFVPGANPITNSLSFVRGLIAVAHYIAGTVNTSFFQLAVTELSHYSYPLIAIQSVMGRRHLFRYICSLRRLGLGCTPLFYLYSALLLIMGSRRYLDRCIRFTKNVLGYTPRLGIARVLSR